jgi:hypothetical protein
VTVTATPCGFALPDWQFPTARRGYVGTHGGGVLLSTADGGARWRVVWRAPRGWGLEALTMLTARTGYAVEAPTACGAVQPAVLLHTDDGGAAWTRVAVLPKGLGPVAFLTSRLGFAGGQRCRPGPKDCRPALWETRDGGRRWVSTGLVGAAPGLGAGPVALAPGLVSWAPGGRQVVVLRAGAPPLTLRIRPEPGAAVDAALDQDSTGWVAGGRVFLLLTGVGLFTGPARPLGLLRPTAADA